MKNLQVINSAEEAVKQDYIVVYYATDTNDIVIKSNHQKKYPIRISANGDGEFTVNYGLGIDAIHFYLDNYEIICPRSKENDVEREGIQYYAYLYDGSILAYITQSEVGVYSNTYIYGDLSGEGEWEEMPIDTLIVTTEGSLKQQVLSYNEGDNQILYADSPIMSVMAFNGGESGNGTITSIEIPNSVTKISNYAFPMCTSLTSVTIPNSVTSIGLVAFEYCTSLTRLNSNTDGVFNIPSSVTTIGEFAFGYCTSLSSVTIPNSVTKIGGYAFQGCSGLTSVTIPDSVNNISRCEFASCTSLTSVTIPNSVTSIAGEAFEVCTSLTSITIPNSVTSIAYRVFSKCNSLDSIIYDGTIEQWKAIDKYSSWKESMPTTCVVYCTDGDIPIADA